MGIRLRTAVLLFLAALFAVSAPAATADARGKRKSAKVKKAKKKKKKAPPKDDGIQEAKIEDDPWADEAEGEGEEEAGDDEAEEADTETGDEEAEGADTEPGDEEPPPSIAPPKEESAMDSLQRSGRMEFDERLVKGQAAKSGAVYLFKRVPRRLPGLVPMRRSYRKRIVAPVLGDRELKPVVVSDRKEASTAKDDRVEPKKEPPAAGDDQKEDEPENEPEGKSQTDDGKKKHGGK